jgi:catechol 2,3-dioxygenase-like lactoylglutathione lyase family enzyme
MFAYATVGTNNHDKALPFYDAVMQAIGKRRVHSYTDDGWYAWGEPSLGPELLWLCTPYNHQPAAAGNGCMLSFAAQSSAKVDAAHAAALAHGGRCEGPPGFREQYGPGLYVAYMRDPDGNKFSVLFRLNVE